MLTENTITKLQEMRLSTMANAFKEQLADPNISELSFEDRFGLLVDKEWATRKNNHLTKLIKKANFADTGACVEDIAYDKARKLDKAQISRLAGCNYIFEYHNLMLLGATGSGKTYIACAFGMSAVRQFLPVRYVGLPELITELAIARTTGTYSKVIEQYKKPSLPILDELSYISFNRHQSELLFQVISDRSEKKSTIVTTNLPFSKWTELFENDTMVSALVDRLTFHSHILDMNGVSVIRLPLKERHIKQ